MRVILGAQISFVMIYLCLMIFQSNRDTSASPPSEYEAVKAHINKLLQSKVIGESCSPYASPIVLVRKKGGSIRLCVDYRLLNSKTR